MGASTLSVVADWCHHNDVEDEDVGVGFRYASWKRRKTERKPATMKAMALGGTMFMTAGMDILPLSNFMGKKEQSAVV